MKTFKYYAVIAAYMAMQRHFLGKKNIKIKKPPENGGK